jgi:hypothetical protein
METVRMHKHISLIGRANRAEKLHLVVVAEFLHEGGLDGFGRRAVAAARVAHEDQHLLRRFSPHHGHLLGHHIHIHIPTTPSPASSLAGVTAPAAQIQPKGREPERRDLVPVHPHELRELAPHPVQTPGGGGGRARYGHGEGERRAGATARAGEEGGMVGGWEGRGGGEGRDWERRVE